jgi:hypothetical protein
VTWASVVLSRRPDEQPAPIPRPRRPDDPIPARTDLRPIPDSRIPIGYRRGFQLTERLQGLGLLILGCLGLLAVYWVYQNGGQLPGAPPPPPAPPGLRGITVTPIISATNCMMPLLTIGSTGLILVGLRRIFDPW